MSLKSQESICSTNKERFGQSFLNETVLQILTRFSGSSVLGFSSFFFMTYTEAHCIRVKLAKKENGF